MKTDINENFGLLSNVIDWFDSELGTRKAGPMIFVESRLHFEDGRGQITLDGKYPVLNVGPIAQGGFSCSKDSPKE